MAKNVRDYVEFVAAKQAPGTPHNDKFRIYGKKVGNITRLFMKLDDGLEAPVAGRLAHEDMAAADNALIDTPIILADATGGAFDVTLPAVASSAGYQFTIKKIDAGVNAVTVEGNGAETIDGAANYALAQQYDAVTVYCDGSEWHIIGEVVRS